MNWIEWSLRWGAILSYTVWRVYWWKSEKRTKREKPKQKVPIPLFSQRSLTRIGVRAPMGITVLQLLGLQILPITSYQFTVQIIGFLLVVLGVWIAILARRELSSNWEAAYEYQIKKKHELITSGIYHYIRHPIYTGVILMILGGQLVALSYLLIPMLAFIGIAYVQAKKEEEMLSVHFGDTYKKYMKKTKMFLPFIW